PPAPPRALAFDPARQKDPEFKAVVDEVDAAFRAQWAELDLKPAAPGSDLTVARRLSLALTGTGPSLQELRQLEALPADERLAWWVAGILQDRRYADYFAERLARAYVGTEDGPFILFRRHRFVSWLSDELNKNTSYGSLLSELIGQQGLWTDKPA